MKLLNLPFERFKFVRKIHSSLIFMKQMYRFSSTLLSIQLS